MKHLNDDPLVMFAEITRHLASQPTEQAVLDQVVALALEVLPGCDDAGIMLLTDKRDVETAAASGQRVKDSDAAQARVGEGPCFDAAVDLHDTNQSFRCRDTHTETRWPAYLPAARALGVGSMLGFQLFHHERTFGALNLYSDRAGAFDADTERLGWVLASHAAVALIAARTDAQMHGALENSRMIGQAIGMIRERYAMPEDQALAVLRRLSQDSNRKLKDVAEVLVSTGQLPDATG